MKGKKQNTDNPNGEGREDIILEVRDALHNFALRLDEVEDKVGEIGRGEDGHKVILAKQFYQSDARGILEVSRISNLSPGPLSLALAVGDYLGKDIQSGEVSLPRKRIDYFLRAQLSAFNGWNRGMSMEVLREQVSVEGRESEGIFGEIEAGGK